MQPHPGRTLCGGDNSVSLSVKFGEPRLKVGFLSQPLGVNTGIPVARKGEDVPSYTGDYTVTPSTTAQTLPTNGKKMTDDLTVESMPQGSVEIVELVLDMSPTITVNNSGLVTARVQSNSETIEATVTPGYVDSVPSSSVSYSGEDTHQIPTLGAQQITPTAATQTIQTKNKYMTGNITVNPIPLQNILLRPDIEKIKTYSNDSLAVTDDEVTLPDYNSSKAVTIKASANLSGTVTLDFDNYNYFVIERFLTTPVYNTNTPAVSRNEYSIGTVAYELLDIPANTFSAANGTKYASRAVGVAAYTGYRLLYWSSASAVGVYTSTTYGVHQVASAPSISSGKLTVKSPTLQFRGSSSYLTSAVYGTITDIRRQFVIDVYRSPKGTLNIDGWGLNQQALSILNDVNNNNGKLR